MDRIGFSIKAKMPTVIKFNISEISLSLCKIFKIGVSIRYSIAKFPGTKKGIHPWFCTTKLICIEFPSRILSMGGRKWNTGCVADGSG
jgi:hypothetical protein